LNDSKKAPHINGMPGMAVYAERLRVADLRVTRPRVGILMAVQANPHADTESIFGIVRAALPEVSRQTVYDVLHTLTEVGLLRRFQPLGSVTRYETRVGDNHHHFVCRGCGAIADVDCSVSETPCLIPSGECGFLLDETEVIYWGFCQTCSSGAVTEVATPTAPAQTCRDHKPAIPPEAVTPYQGNAHPSQKPTPSYIREVALSRTGTSFTPWRVAATKTGGHTGST
jgi:Fur family ferric uptake transcriptional regulator